MTSLCWCPSDSHLPFYLHILVGFPYFIFYPTFSFLAFLEFDIGAVVKCPCYYITFHEIIPHCSFKWLVQFNFWNNIRGSLGPSLMMQLTSYSLATTMLLWLLMFKPEPAGPALPPYSSSLLLLNKWAYCFTKDNVKSFWEIRGKQLISNSAWICIQASRNRGSVWSVVFCAHCILF